MIPVETLATFFVAPLLLALVSSPDNIFIFFIFFLAFLTFFSYQQHGPVAAQILLLGGALILSTNLVFGAIALLAGTLGELLTRSECVQGTLNKRAGSVFLGPTLKMATLER
jgi:threonine/homoserine/homoserine lactone efflux protein